MTETDRLDARNLQRALNAAEDEIAYLQGQSAAIRWACFAVGFTVGSFFQWVLP